MGPRRRLRGRSRPSPAASRWASSFVARCVAVEDPVIDLELLLSPRLALVTAINLSTTRPAFFGLLFSFMLFLSAAWHLSLIEAGLAIAADDPDGGRALDHGA